VSSLAFAIADVAVADIQCTPRRQTETPEQILVRRLKAGDADAFEELVRTSGGRLLAVARRFLRDEEAARDVVQETFLSAFRAIQGFDGHSQLSTWLHRIAVNAALMRLRVRQRRAEQSIEPLLPAFADDGHHAEPVMSWTDCPERALEQKQMRAVMRAAIGELPDSYRTVLLMRDIEGLSTQEAADILGISENALKLRLHRARQALAAIVRGRLGLGAPAPASGRAVAATASGRSTRRAAGAPISVERSMPLPAMPRAAAMFPDRFAGAAIPAVAM
jgi:RNA polymerase sigma-70 factor, ECF subfamily